MASIANPNSGMTTCPLLKLPPELRMEIYRLAFAGHTLHIDRPGCLRAGDSLDGTAHLCKQPSFDEEQFELIGWSPAPNRTICGFTLARGHIRCRAPAIEILPLGLLLACREIHHEARLVPFQENNFTFSSPRSVYALLLRLTESQKMAIRTITLYQSATRTEWMSPIQAEDGGSVTPLPGVTSIRVVVETCSANFTPEWSAYIAYTEGQDKLLAGMKMFCSPNVKGVDVLINNTQPRMCKTLTPAEVEAWTVRTEQTLLPADSKPRYGLKTNDKEIEDLKRQPVKWRFDWHWVGKYHMVELDG